MSEPKTKITLPFTAEDVRRGKYRDSDKLGREVMDIVLDVAAHRLSQIIEEIVKTKIDPLEALLMHCSVHSGYQNCGYDEMTTEQKALFDAVTKT